MRLSNWLALLLLGLLLLGGCGQGSGPGPLPTRQPTATAVDLTTTRQVTLHIIDTKANPSSYGFDPLMVRIKVGTTVTWVNLSQALHTVTSGVGVPDGKFDSGEQNLLFPPNQGESSIYTAPVFMRPGAYPYYCVLHPAMVGEILVVP